MKYLIRKMPLIVSIIFLLSVQLQAHTWEQKLDLDDGNTVQATFEMPNYIGEFETIIPYGEYDYLNDKLNKINYKKESVHVIFVPDSGEPDLLIKTKYSGKTSLFAETYPIHSYYNKSLKCYLEDDIGGYGRGDEHDAGIMLSSSPMLTSLMMQYYKGDSLYFEIGAKKVLTITPLQAEYCLKNGIIEKDGYVWPGLQKLLESKKEMITKKLSEIPNCETEYMKVAVTVNKEAYQVPMYIVNDSIYIRLKDMAKLLNDRYACFNIDWDGNEESIQIIPGMYYTENGSELKQVEGKAKSGKEIPFMFNYPKSLYTTNGYYIEDEFYFNFNHLMTILGLEYNWNDENECIVINTQLRNIAIYQLEK